MVRIIVGIVILISAVVFVRHQFNVVAKEITGKPKPIFPTQTTTSQKCIMCAGTGRMKVLSYSGNSKQIESKVCPTCNGTGWVNAATP